MGILKTKTKGILIVISGPSGAGKGTICDNLKKNNNKVWMSTSMTTRNIRGNEKNGCEYYFISKKEFENIIKNDGFLEYACVHDNYYGTPKEKIAERLIAGYDVILEIDIQGALNIQDKVSDALFIFIMPPSMEELKERLTKRNTDSEEAILTRFKNAYQEINEVTKYNYVVVNDDINEAVKKVESIIIAEKCRVDRIEEVFLNNKEELLHEQLKENK